MKKEVPVLPEEMSSLGYEVSDVLTAMTYLEILGLVEAAVGGYYIRHGEYNIEMPSLND